jgi:hypothetical protein
VTITMALSPSDKDVGGLMEGYCDGSLDINKISIYYGLKMVFGHRIFVGK